MSKNKMKKINIILFASAVLIFSFAAGANAAPFPSDDDTGIYSGWKCTPANNYACTYRATWLSENDLYESEGACKISPSCLPVTTLTAEPTTINVGESTNISWSADTGATSCVGTPDGSFPYTLNTPGSSPWSWSSPGEHWVSMYCSNANGSGPTATKYVTVVQPPSATCSISANPSSGTLSHSNPSVSGTLSWTASGNPSSCSIAASCSGDYGTGVCDDSPGSVSPASGGSVSFSTQLPTSYTMTCANVTGSGTCSTMVDVSGAPPTIDISATPSAGTTGVAGVINYSLTSNDPRLAARDYTCTKFASPSTPGWGSGSPAPLSGSGVSASGSASYPALSQTTTFGITCRDEYGNFAGSGQTKVTVQPPAGDMHFACDPNNNSCVMVEGSGPNRCEPTHLCGTGSLTITPTDNSVGVGGELVYQAWYTNGSIKDLPIGEGGLGEYGADINSANLNIIKRTSGGAESVILTGVATGTTLVSGGFQGLVASTPVTVSEVSRNVQLAITPYIFGPEDANAVASVIGGKPNSTGELSRVAKEYDLYPDAARTLPWNNPSWIGTDASGSGSKQSPHSCADDGSGSPVKGYRQEVETHVSFVGWGQSNSLVAIKDCRGTIRVTSRNGYPSAWQMNGPTPADNTNVLSVNKVNSEDNQEGSSGDDWFVSYKATDGQYTISDYQPCSLVGPASQSIGPGDVADFVLVCPSGASHLECLGNSCVRVRGGGSDKDGCTGSGQVCSGGTNHLGCVNNSCAVLPGGGANQDGCTAEDGVCISNPKYLCNSDGTCTQSAEGTYDSQSSCESVCVDSETPQCTGSIPASSSLCPGDGTNLTEDTPITLVDSCTAPVKCEARCGAGYVRSGTICVPASCPSGQSNPHNGCIAGSCVSIPGCGVTDCTACSTPPGGGTHKECVNNACTSVAGAGSDRCSVSADCGGGGGGDPFHSACDPSTQSCVNVAGAGENLCANDPQCTGTGITHLECQNNACVIVGGAGENQCTTIGPGCTAPTSCTMSANPRIFSKGGSSVLTWTCDAGVTDCVLYDATSGVKVSLGSVPTSCPTSSSCGAIQKITPAKTGQYILECLKGGIKTTANVGVTVTSIIECNPIDPTCKQ